MIRAAVAVAASLLLAAPAVAEPVRPIGSFGISGDLTLSGPAPRSRFAVDATVYVNQRVGLYAAAHQVTMDPLGDAGRLTAGIAYRAAAARPRLEVVLHGDAGIAWGVTPEGASRGALRPALGGGVTTYLWPVTSLPFAVTTGAHAYVVLDGLEDTHLAFSLGLGVAVSR